MKNAINVPKWVRQIEQMDQDALESPKHYSSVELELMPYFRMLISALKSAIEALEECDKGGFYPTAREAIAKIREGKFE